MTPKVMIDAMAYRGNRFVLAWHMARAGYFYSRRYGAGPIAAAFGAATLFLEYAKHGA